MSIRMSPMVVVVAPRVVVVALVPKISIIHLGFLEFL